MTIRDIIFIIEIAVTAFAFIVNCISMVVFIKKQKEYDDLIKKEKENISKNKNIR